MEQSQARNISGIFQLEIDGKKRDLKCNFGVVEELEKTIFKRPIVVVLSDAMNGMVFTTDVVYTIIEGLKGNGDTRFSVDAVKEEVIKNGMDEYLEFYIKFLTYAISGDKSLEVSKKKTRKK